MGRVRITRLFVLLGLAALLAPRAEASRTNVWESHPPSYLTATKADAAGMLASLAPAAQLDTSALADAEAAEPPLFNLGDIVFVETEREEHFDLGPLTLVDLNLLRGPPPSYPETRVGGLELLPPFRVGASPSLSLWGRQACGFSCGEVASDSRYDPLGLQAAPGAAGPGVGEPFAACGVGPMQVFCPKTTVQASVEVTPEKWGPKEEQLWTGGLGALAYTTDVVAASAVFGAEVYGAAALRHLPRSVLGLADALEAAPGAYRTWRAARAEAKVAGQLAGAGRGTSIIPEGGWAFESKAATPAEILQGVTSRKAAELAANPSLARGVLTRPEYEAAQKSVGVARMQYGNAVERLAAKEIRTTPELRSIFEHVGGPRKPDFIGKGAFERMNFDITTPGQVQAHLNRPGYGPGLNVVTYERPAGFTLFPE